MDKPDRSTYTPIDFLEWQESGALELVPKFQRRGVWSTPARSFFIDTLIRSMPVPPIYLRTRQSDDRKKIVREVVDGQQRIAAVLDFVGEKYALSKSLDAIYAGRWFSDLPEELANAIRTFRFNCEVMQGISDTEVLEIFARLNTYSVQLSNQELRNGTYFGYFKQSAYRLALEHIEFWRKHAIFSERRIARMLEVELTSEVMIAALDGLQDKKKSINEFYAKFDDKFSGRSDLEKKFRKTIDMIEESAGEILADSEFRRPPLFYSLFAVIYHRVFGIPKQKRPSPRQRLTDSERKSVRSAVLQLSQYVRSARGEDPVPEAYSSFVLACLQQTDNIQPRQTRFDTLYKQAF